MPRYGQVANSIGEHINRIDIAWLCLNGMTTKNNQI
jgi:hypothetical protein